MTPTLCQYIEKAYQDNPTSIHISQADFHACRNGILWQNTYLANQQLVPLEGISSNLMFLSLLPGNIQNSVSL